MDVGLIRSNVSTERDERSKDQGPFYELDQSVSKCRDGGRGQAKPASEAAKAAYPEAGECVHEAGRDRIELAMRGVVFVLYNQVANAGRLGTAVFRSRGTALGDSVSLSD